MPLFFIFIYSTLVFTFVIYGANFIDGMGTWFSMQPCSEVNICLLLYGWECRLFCTFFC
ncbi:hypothetical protein BDZ91DRAFT_737846, partial [Kalaharituber pfeilii]